MLFTAESGHFGLMAIAGWIYSLIFFIANKEMLNKMQSTPVKQFKITPYI